MNIDELPPWIQRRFKLSQRALRTLAKKRGKNFRVFKGLDMKGV